MHYTDGRKEPIEEIWTDPILVGVTSLARMPIFILTNFYVASGAEDVAYSLQAQARATFVGTTTVGAAHSGTSHYREDLQLNFSIPHGYVVNSVTATDWDGVQPDIETSDNMTLAKAQALAWEKIGYTPSETDPETELFRMMRCLAAQTTGMDQKRCLNSDLAQICLGPRLIANSNK